MPTQEKLKNTMKNQPDFKYNIGDILAFADDDSYITLPSNPDKMYRENLRVLFRFFDGKNVYVVEDGQDVDGFAFCVMEDEVKLMQHSTTPNTLPDNQPANSRQLDEETYLTLARLGIFDTSVRSHNQGSSDYARHVIQPWAIWQDYKLNPWDADIVKRVLRTKLGNSRRLDYEKIIHICEERIRQIDFEDSVEYFGKGSV